MSQEDQHPAQVEELNEEPANSEKVSKVKKGSRSEVLKEQLAVKDKEAKKELKRTSSLIRFKVGVAGKVGNSKLGKKALPPEVRALLKSFRTIVTKVCSSNKAKDIETLILKFIIKAKVHVDNKTITVEHLLQADKPLREAFETFAELFDFYGDAQVNRLVPKFKRVADLIRQVEKITVDIFSPHLRPKNLERLKSLFNFIADVDFYIQVWSHPDVYLELFLLVNSMNKYTQFHF
eukprot:TRINITY_DN8673_c0_g1_i1.p1 TRINITY_DN8673_c0_g1~~TRINITY_DN8673_c0_g1_i1.p1  ORF type:complete len:235 (+),score=47.16 TRINITY_DN8673_c0_g1_i1:23-727(+)